MNNLIDIDQIEQIKKSDEFKNGRQVILYLRYLNGSGKSYEDIKNILLTKKWNFKDAENLKEVVDRLCACAGFSDQMTPKRDMCLTKKEYDLLLKYKGNYRKFLYSALWVYKWNWHSSGWVEYDRESISSLLLSKVSLAQRQQIIKDLFEDRIIDFRVIGSKHPVTCYKILVEDDSETYYQWDSTRFISGDYEVLFGALENE